MVPGDPPPHDPPPAMRPPLTCSLMLRGSLLLAGTLLAGSAAPAAAQENDFSKLVGDVKVGRVVGGTLRVPYITWGGDVATFHANGGLKTAEDSGFGELGLNLELTAGDDFVAQVRDYVSGKSPFLRGTFRMLGQASGVLGADPRTKPVVILQLSWSNGDHVVVREGVRTINDLKGKNIAVQQGGPHVGLLYDALKSGGLSKDDVKIVWVPDLTGENGPAEKFRADDSIAACCVITPDMLGLTGGVTETGSGAEGTVKGATVVVSTQELTRSIADVYAVRSDWLEKPANRETAQKFAAGWLKARDGVVALRNDFEKTGRMNAEYRRLLAQSQQIFGEDVLPTLEVDAHGLLLDCEFANLPGQIEFFQRPGNLVGFDAKLTEALDMAVSWGYTRNRSGFDPAPWDYREIAKLAGLEYREPSATRRLTGPEVTTFGPDMDLDSDTLVSFTINFEPNQDDFPADRYGAEFRQAIENAAKFGGAVIVVRGHSDPTLVLREMIQAGIQKGLIKRTGSGATAKYFLQGRELDVTQADRVAELVQSGQFEAPPNYRPRLTMQSAQQLSLKRAAAVKEAVGEYAKQLGVELDLSALQPVGAGIADPVIPKPTSLAEAKQNMRVEFRIVRVQAETLAPSDFDF